MTQQPDITHDADRDALVVRGEACDPIVGLDFESACNVELACCAASMPRVQGPCLDAWSTANGQGTSSRARPARSSNGTTRTKAIFVASNPGNSAAARAYPALANALTDIGYTGPILEPPEFDQGTFSFNRPKRRPRAATFTRQLGALVQAQSVPPDHILPPKPGPRP